TEDQTPALLAALLLRGRRGGFARAPGRFGADRCRARRTGVAGGGLLAFGPAPASTPPLTARLLGVRLLGIRLAIGGYLGSAALGAVAALGRAALGRAGGGFGGSSGPSRGAAGRAAAGHQVGVDAALYRGLELAGWLGL